LADVRRSKRLSYWLRHAPQAAALSLDPAGWAPTQDVLRALAAAGLPTSVQELEALVSSSDKQRFELTPDGEKIRARQGHSVQVQGDWPEAVPPDLLYHGTAWPSLEPIFREGLRPGRRHHVHLSPTIDLATAVGRRKGRAVVLEVDAEKMARDGFTFRLSSNGVWLADHVPPAYLRHLDQAADDAPTANHDHARENAGCPQRD
jgi:putative RNA 2'-phosphotransferase